MQKIFYFHMPPAMLMLWSAIFCGVVSGLFLIRKRQIWDHLAVAAAELTVLYGLIAMVTGPLWARKAWGVWWTWDPRLTMSLLMWMIFVSYLLLRKYGGPGSEKLAAGLAVFGMANAPFVYISVNVWRTMHPKTTVVPTLPVDFATALWVSFGGFLLLYAFGPGRYSVDGALRRRPLEREFAAPRGAIPAFANRGRPSPDRR